jgi:hypothetical protein
MLHVGCLLVVVGWLFGGLEKAMSARGNFIWIH